MRILVVTYTHIPHEGGLATHVHDLIAGMRGRGHDVALVHGGQATAPGWMRFVRAAQALGSRDRYVQLSIAAVVDRLAQRVSRELRTFGPELVHCHDPLAAVATARALGGQDIPLVETVHGPLLYEMQQLRGRGGMPRLEAYIYAREQEAFARAVAFIAVDTGQANILVDDYGVTREKITVIFNCVNVEEIRALAAQATNRAPRRPFLLVPRRLVPKTGVRFALEAMAQLTDLDVDLVVAGDGPLRGELELLAQQLRVTDRVHFLGAVPRPELMPLFGRALAVLVPSVPATGVVEATSLAVTEAMAAGSVPVASAIGGLAELIQHQETGLLVPPGDAAALGAALRDLVTKSDLRSRLVAGGTRKVETDYSTPAWLGKIEAVYRRGLERAAHAAHRPLTRGGSG